MPLKRKRRICFVTGTRAEFGLMVRTLHAIQSHPDLQLQIIATGMHLASRHGSTFKDIALDFKIDRLVPWPATGKSQTELAISTGKATAALAKALAKLKTDIVLIVGDRVEAFAAASAAHLSGKIVAHVHGGDRAAGQVDDSLRHAITKLSHIHFPATKASASRIAKLGEDKWRIRRVGSPGVEAITSQAARVHPMPEPFALLVLHPQDASDLVERKRAKLVFGAVERIGFPNIVIIYPNNDPGSRGIIRCWDSLSQNRRVVLHRNVRRDTFLALLRDAAVLLGNSSSGIIEAASFRTPVIDIGSRQLGRERGQNVTNVPYRQDAIAAALKRIWNRGHPMRARGDNIYAAPHTARRIANTLAAISIDSRLARKLIAY